MRVLIDGGYFRESQGTGISSYTRTLRHGLEALGHEIAWLSGAKVSKKADRLSDAAAVFDQPEPARGPRQWVETCARMAAALTTSIATAREVAHRDVVAVGSAEKDSSIFLAPELFVRAHYRHILLRQFTEVRLDKQVDILHLTAPLPIRMSGIKRVVTIHDLIPIRLPHTTPDNKEEFISRVRTSVREADLIVTVSETSKADIVSLLDVEPQKIAVTYLASDLEVLPDSERSRLPLALSRFDLHPDNYLLFVGAQEPKKNVRRLIEAFLEVDTPLPLVLAGPRGWMWEREVGAVLAPLGETARKRLRFTGYVGREDLQRLYAGAAAFIYPSLYEGFGLPPLDAMAAGCPSVVSSNGSLPEVCGDAAYYVDPFERTSIRGGIERILSDLALRSDLAAKGPAQAARYSFDAYLTRLGQAYAALDN